MRANKKNELFGCIDSLTQINNQLNRISNEERQELLPLCQEMAAKMGGVIERWEGEGTRTVALLEKYCEEIYHIHVGARGMDFGHSYRTIKELLAKIRDSIMSMEDSPYEILFLPYKASMWDCLESVYRAAAGRADCRVSVMPIPYYNVNPQGQILSVEYEGKQFPEGIPITDFREYDLKKMEPDAIFIHNPYDQYNYVTQVADDFFSSELIKYTPRLVYIPYFVTSCDTIQSHYCLVPGVKNAWRTFVQSEGVREGYLQYVFNKERIVTLGSPKFDKVKEKEDNLKRVPQEWKNAFQGKKVFFLNTHLNFIISQSAMMMDKLSLIFQYFHKNEDIALLWRPHPLSVETAKSLSPDFLNKYLRLVEEYKTLSIGIYDESADIHRAIAVSDGYVGSISSVTSLYGVTGKPIYAFSYTVNNITKNDEIEAAKDGRTQLERKLEDSMRNIADSYKYLYHESFISLEYYIELIKSGKDICKQERKARFTALQYGWAQEQSAGERIWNYVYHHIENADSV